MHTTNHTQHTRTAEDRTMTASTVMGVARRRLARVTFTLLGAVLLIALPASLGAEQRVLVLDKSFVTVAEAGGTAPLLTATYNVRLNTKPTGTVTVTVASSDTKAATANLGSLTFGPTDWKTLKPVIVTGGPDDMVDNPAGGRFATIKHTPIGSGFSTPKNLAVVVTDDDTAGLAFVPDTEPVMVTEKGRGDTPGGTAGHQHGYLHGGTEIQAYGHRDRDRSELRCQCRHGES